MIIILFVETISMLQVFMLAEEVLLFLYCFAAYRILTLIINMYIVNNFHGIL